MTTDVWSSLSKQSYITVTAHLIDDDVKLHKFVLDTSEIKVRHTSENLLAHVKKVMKTFNLNDKLNEVTVNGNYAEENEENYDGVDHLREIGYYSGDEYEDNDESDQLSQNIIDSQETSMTNSQTYDSQYSQILDSSQLLDLDSPPDLLSQASGLEEQEGLKQSVTMTSDNASYITKALRDLGCYRWFGCAGHHLNLVVKQGFMKHQAAAKLLKNCKSIVQLAHKSLPFLYDFHFNDYPHV